MPQHRRLDYAEIARLYDVEGLSFMDIAQRLGASKSAVNRAYHRGKAGPSAAREKSASQATKEQRIAASRRQADGQAGGKSLEISAEHEEDFLGLLEWWKHRKEAEQMGQVVEPYERQAGAASRVLALRQVERQAGGSRKKQTYRIEEALLDQLRAYAGETGVPQSIVVNEALRLYLQDRT